MSPAIYDTLQGYALIWGAVSKDYRRILVERDTKIQLGRDLYADFDHDPLTAFAFHDQGSLRVQRDHIGLAVEIDILDGRVASKLRGGGWGMSVGMHIDGERYQPENYGGPFDPIGKVNAKWLDAELGHVSLTRNPAFPQTGAWLKSEPPSIAHNQDEDRRKVRALFKEFPEFRSDTRRTQLGGDMLL